MAQPVYDPASEAHAERAERLREAPAPAPAPVAASAERSLSWASAVGNNAVQRVARQSVAREAVEEEEPEAEEPEGAGEAVGEAAPAGPDEELKPEEAEGLDALDELPEDELPE